MKGCKVFNLDDYRIVLLRNKSDSSFVSAGHNTILRGRAYQILATRGVISSHPLH